MSTRVTIDVESLVLRGFRPEDKHAIMGAIRDELARRFAEPGAAERIGRHEGGLRIDAGAIHLANDAPAVRAGAMAGERIASVLSSVSRT